MRYTFTEKQLQMMKQAGLLFQPKGNLSDEQQMEIDLVITDYLIENGINDDETVNEIGKVCEEILNIISQ